MIERAGWEGMSGFELALAPSSEDHTRYTIESVRDLDERAARETLRTFGLALVLRAVISGSLRTPGMQSSITDRIVIARLAPIQTLRMFEAICGRHPGVDGLYADLEGEGFYLIPGRARGTVMRSYTADGVARGGCIFVDLPHEGTVGEIAVFHVSIREGTRGGSRAEARADYSIRRGERVEIP